MGKLGRAGLQRIVRVQLMLCVCWGRVLNSGRMLPLYHVGKGTQCRNIGSCPFTPLPEATQFSLSLCNSDPQPCPSARVFRVNTCEQDFLSCHFKREHGFPESAVFTRIYRYPTDFHSGCYIGSSPGTGTLGWGAWYGTKILSSSGGDL